jgi:hypothetical protein
LPVITAWRDNFRVGPWFLARWYGSFVHHVIGSSGRHDIIMGDVNLQSKQIGAGSTRRFTFFGPSGWRTCKQSRVISRRRRCSARAVYTFALTDDAFVDCSLS